MVAQIDTVFSITLNDVQQYVYEYHFHRLYKPLSAGYRAALEQIVTKRLKVFDFFDQHLNRDSTILSSMGYTLTEELLNEYFKNQYYDKYINETKARELYLLTGRVVIYQQIVLQKLDSVTKKSLDSLRTLANVIKTRAEGGESFLLLYKRYN
ncbi:MAG: hypothetical protein N3A63_09520, partial [Bacteroidetes bacterium]|nr:hypothetical protein [Bacteroidota bacterium]